MGYQQEGTQVPREDWGVRVGAWSSGGRQKEGRSGPDRSANGGGKTGVMWATTCVRTGGGGVGIRERRCSAGGREASMDAAGVTLGGPGLRGKGTGWYARLWERTGRAMVEWRSVDGGTANQGRREDACV